MATFLPETRNPETVTVTTGNNTIAAGKYAHVTIVCSNGQAALINGVTAISSLTKDNFSTISGSTVGSTLYTSPSGVISVIKSLVTSNNPGTTTILRGYPALPFGSKSDDTLYTKTASSISIKNYGGEAEDNATTTATINQSRLVFASDELLKFTTGGNNIGYLITFELFGNTKITNMTTVSASFWLKAGDAITGTGSKTVSVYSIP